MSKTYVTRTDDTLQKISILYYGSASKWTRIWNANPSLSYPDRIFPGITLVIPDLPERKTQQIEDPPEEIEVTEETIDDETGLSSEVAILIDGQPFRLWNTFDINFSFDAIGDEFTLSTPWFPEIERYRETFKYYRYQQCVLYLGGKRVLTGEVHTPATSAAANSRVLTLNGYSLPGRLANVTASPRSWPLEFSGLNLFQIAENLSKYFGIKIVGEGDPGAVFKKDDKVAMEPTQKIGDFLIKLAQQRGFTLSSNEYGYLLLHKPTEEAAEVSIIEGQWPFLSAEVSGNGNERFSDVTMLGTNNKSGAGQRITISDPELKRNGIVRPLVYKAQDTVAGGLKQAAIAKLGRDIANSFSCNVNVEGIYRSDKKLWKDNQKVIFQSDGNMIYEETEFLIRSANLKKQSNAEETSLTLVFPECYNGEIREEFPWD